MRRRHITCLAAAVATLGVAPMARAQGREMATLVHRASGLTVQSQRLVKAAAQLGLGIEAADARRILAACVADSQRSVETLVAAPAAAPARSSFQALGKLWARAAADTQGAPTRASVDALLLLDHQLLSVALEATTQLLWQSKQPELNTLTTTAQLGMLSQRLAKFHFCALWGVAPRIAASQAPKAREEFLSQLAVLKAAARTPAQKEALDGVTSQWVFFNAALQASSLGADAGVHARLARASEAMLLVLGEVAPRFVRLG
jgi:hypothetical protein